MQEFQGKRVCIRAGAISGAKAAGEVLLVAISDKILNRLGFSVMLVDRFIQKFYPHLW
jgi:hypothetical protein